MGVTTTINTISPTNTPGERYDFEIWTSIGLPIVILGVVSNAFFLLSVGRALKASRHGFGVDKWQWILLLNLAAMDFFYCMNFVVNGVIGLIKVEEGKIPGFWW